ncbi:MAG: EAL domain-containing protein [Gammaproteobacteria bacterium]|nr:EAL domain-containing protein [Gammaproteobacteria bacterium]
MWQRLRQFGTASIGRQLILGIALVHAILMTIFVFDLVHRQRDFLVEESGKQAIALAEALAANGTSWILANDFIGMEEVINSQRHYPGLRYAMFTDLNGQVLAYTDRSQVGRYLDDPVSRRLLRPALPAQPLTLIDDQDLVDVAHPVVIQGKSIGWARVGVSRAGIAGNLQLVTFNGLVYTALAIIVGILFAWLMARSMTSDIRRLVSFADAIRAGERKIQFALDRRDELGDLSRDINRMLETLVDRENELISVHARVERNERRLHYALEGSSDGLWDWDLRTGEVYLSPRWKGMLGYRDDELPSAFSTWQQLLHPDDAPAAEASLKKYLADREDTFEVLHRMRHHNGAWHWILSRGKALRDEHGKPFRMVGTHVDVTDQKELEQSLVRERKRALVTLRSIGDGVITTLADGSVDYLNPVAEELTGWSLDEARGRPIDAVFPIIDETTRQPRDNPVERCMHAARVIAMDSDTLLINRHDREIPIEDSAAPIRNEDNQVVGAVLVFHDATTSRQMQRQIEHQALHDDLTGLWSRRAFDNKLAEVTEAAMRGKGRHILVYIDLDQFKVVNDTVGHLAGDELLKQVATYLQTGIRDADMLARLGGDEFGLLLIGCDLEHGMRVAENLRNRLEEFRFTWNEQSFQISASFGVAVIDADLHDPKALSLADLACYGAKEQGRNRIHVYHPDDHDLAQRRTEMHWVARIKQALDEDRLVLYAQKILPLQADAARNDYREILVRMLDEDGELVPPARFIPAAERYGLMSRIDAAVIAKAFDWLEQAAGDEAFVSINLSGGSLADAALMADIERRLERAPQLGQRLCFEVTETAAIGNLRDALGFIGRLKQRKVSFALDDFGSGLSSFGYLKTLPVDFLKIDGSFVRDLLDDPVDAVMVESIAKVSREMGIKTIAEFVENQALLERLRKIGVHYGQGYGIEKPVPLYPESRSAMANHA